MLNIRKFIINSWRFVLTLRKCYLPQEQELCEGRNIAVGFGGLVYTTSSTMADQNKLKKRLEALLKIPENQVCADCNKRGKFCNLRLVVPEFL